MSSGINIFEEMRPLFGPIEEDVEVETRAEKVRAGRGPCIFLSHKSEDKTAVAAIGNYIRRAGIDIYLDANDPELQKADAAGDDAKVALFIERGIRASSDVMALVSNNTKQSWWVPYEVGFGKSGQKAIACLRLIDVVGRLPAFLNIARRIDNINGLNSYLIYVHGRKPRGARLSSFRRLTDYALRGGTEDLLMESGGFSHPLENYIQT